MGLAPSRWQRVAPSDEQQGSGSRPVRRWALGSGRQPAWPRNNLVGDLRVAHRAPWPTKTALPPLPAGLLASCNAGSGFDKWGIDTLTNYPAGARARGVHTGRAPAWAVRAWPAGPRRSRQPPACAPTAQGDRGGLCPTRQATRATTPRLTSPASAQMEVGASPPPASHVPTYPHHGRPGPGERPHSHAPACAPAPAPRPRPRPRPNARPLLLAFFRGPLADIREDESQLVSSTCFFQRVFGNCNADYMFDSNAEVIPEVRVRSPSVRS